MPVVARTIPENRLKDLLECATRVFIAQGYRRTQIADVARALGVAKGTLYLYVESKEALFAAVLRHADGVGSEIGESALPLPAPAPDSLLRELAETVRREIRPPALVAALSRRRVADVRGELEAIVRELYALSSRHRTAIKLIDRCGVDHPELARAFYEEGRFSQLDALRAYIEERVRRGRLRSDTRPAVAARFLIEAVATWAVHIHWDPAPQAIDPEDAEETLVQFVLGGLLPD